MKRLRLLAALTLALTSLSLTASAAPQEDPRDERYQALLGLARVKRDAGDRAAARQYFEQARQIRPFDRTEQAEYFWVLAGQDAAAALEAGRVVLAFAPHNANVRDRMITEAIALGLEPAVVSLAEEGARVLPDSALWPRRAAESWLRQGDLPRAADAFAAAVTRRDRTIDDWAGLALARQATGKSRDAIAAWTHVPAAALASRPEWMRSRLHALADGAPIDEAAGALTEWLAANPDDEEMRERLVSIWRRAGRPDRALAALPGPDSTVTPAVLRDRIAIARSAGLRSDAVAALKALEARRAARPDEKDLLTELLIDAGLVATAVERLRGDAGATGGCRAAYLALVDRVPGAEGTTLLVTTLSEPGCTASPAWIRRAIERTVAESRHAEALSLVGRLRQADALAPDATRLTGLLRLWTNDAAGAVPELTAALAAAPGDRDVREALIDAHRALRNSRAAWQVAEPIMDDAGLSDTRRLILAELAIEAGEPARVPFLVADIPQDGDGAAARVALEGRALFAQGRLADAHARLNRVHPTQLPAPAALALIDSALALYGPQAALAAARAFDHPPDGDWQTVVARRIVLEAVTGDPDRSDALRTALAAANVGAAMALDDVILGEFERQLAASTSPEARIALLDPATRRFSRNAVLRVRLAAARLAVGDRAGARSAASTALDLDPAAAEAWFLLIDASGDDADAIDDVLDRFDAARANHPALAIELANRLSAFVRSPSDPLVSRLLTWLESAPGDEATAGARSMAIARVYSAAARWPEALDAVGAVLAHDPANGPALDLRAAVLSWSGRHLDAVLAYNAYLAVNPADLSARRQQARVAGWGQQFDLARRLYRALAEAVPGHAGVAAEAGAKLAYYDGRWREAVRAYAHWIAVEPGDSEARFEYAEALRAAGRTADADEALASLASTGQHRLSEEARARTQALRGLTANAHFDARAANGFDGQRLLDLAENGGGVGASFGAAGLATVSVGGGHVRAAAGETAMHGYRAQIRASVALVPAISVDGHASVWDFGTVAGPTPDAGIRLTWRPADRWTIGIGGARTAIFENLATVQQGLTGTGVTAGVTFESPRTFVDGRIARELLSDDNARSRATLTVSRSAGDRLPGLRVVGWAESLHYRDERPGYFSPSRHTRVDGGLEYTHTLHRPRFRDDRRSTFTAGYLIGADSRGTLYHHPMARLSFEFDNGLVLDAQIDRIQSDVYRETRAMIGVRIR